jgi:DNA polymerase (family 10)
MPTNEAVYIDERGRTRWRRNDAIGDKLTELYNFLVIGGYPEAHAKRYNQLAYAISRHPECIDALHAENRLGEIPGIGGTVAGIIGEYVERGTCGKFEEFARETPTSVLELTEIPRLGAKTALLLYAEHGIDSLAGLVEAMKEGRLQKVRGMGPKMLETITAHAEEHL